MSISPVQPVAPVSNYINTQTSPGVQTSVTETAGPGATINIYETNNVSLLSPDTAMAIFNEINPGPNDVVNLYETNNIVSQSGGVSSGSGLNLDAKTIAALENMTGTTNTTDLGTAAQMIGQYILQLLDQALLGPGMQQTYDATTAQNFGLQALLGRYQVLSGGSQGNAGYSAYQQSGQQVPGSNYNALI